MLPTKVEDFKEKDYWDKFFAKCGGKPFEWYGSYKDYRSLMRQEVQPKHNILVVGCGNSLFSEELFADGFPKVTSIDYSEKTISAMQAKTKGPKYEVMDMTDMKYPDGSFDIVFDKATLDAMFSNEDIQAIPLVEATWRNCFRALADKGKYICVTLLQQHILSKVFSYFLDGNRNPLYADRIFVLKIYEVEPVESEKEKHIPFMLVIEQSKIDPKNPGAAKLKAMLSKSICYVALSKKSETISIDQAIATIKDRQMYGYVMHQSKTYEKGRRFQIQCYDAASKLSIPKYILTVVDARNEKLLRKVLQDGENKG